MLSPGLTRFILSISVVAFHLSQSIFLGYFAVGCFLILSGYWIALMFEHKYSKFESKLKVFFISRLWRLMPVFYTFTLLGLLVDHLGKSSFLNGFNVLNIGQKTEVVISNIMLLGYSTSDCKLLVPAWSLDIELQFYIFFALLFCLFKGIKRYLKYLTMSFFVIAISLIIFNQTELLRTSMAYMYLFFVGVMIYHFKLKPSDKVYKWSSIIFLLIIAIQYLIPSLSVYYRNGASIYYTCLSLALILFAIPALIKSVSIKSDTRDKFLGEMSFTVYLSHWIWLGPYNIMIADVTKIERIPYLMGFLLVTFLSAFLIYKYIDRPSERMRHIWLNRQMRTDK
jgi:peptidoglycan/LPS O-acetylase OafA/YrhL